LCFKQITSWLGLACRRAPVSVFNVFVENANVLF
jgi:hypothetical protein